MSMRRGHPGSSGWRTENPRHFRPRGGGTPHFRPTRGYGLLDTPRFPPSGSRQNIGTPYHMHQGPSEDPSLLDRNNYRHTRSQRGLLHGQRQILPYLQQMRQSKDSQEHSPQFSSNYSESANQNDSHHMNLIGDNDLRQHQEPLRHSPWVNPPRNFYDEDRNYGKRPYRRQDDHTDANRSYGPEYTGHRPPASDHYQNPGSARDNSDSFSHSVDDTVDIIRKKMMNRNENPHHSGESIEHSDSDQRGAESAPNSFTLSQREQPAKRRIQREKQTAKANCEKMKSRIVHQLFKMDKDRIHKLMDNPSSSTKFEYAISSLITESQNSFNRHLRSVAEKSLCSSSNEFVNNDKNTIYEDTFMKQMQCILEPQDTVLLEDIKPMVLAELSKVLLLDEYEHNFERSHQAQSHQRNFKTYDYTESSQDHADNQLWQEHDNESVSNYHSEDITNDSKPLFVRRSSRKSEYTDIALPSDRQERSSDHIQERKSIDCTQETFSSDFKEKHDYSEERKASIESRRLSRISTDRLQGDENPTNSVIPLFDPNAEQVSEDDDPFEELDNQYHVPVDHNFLGIDDLANSESSTTNTELESSPRVKKEFSESLYTPKKTNVNTDIHTQLLDIAKAPLNIKSLDFTDIKKEVLLKSEIIKTEENDNTSVTPKSPARPISPLQKDGNNKQDNTQDKTATSEISEDSSNTVKSTSNSRKRSIDQRPSHRKEKRKKSDASRPDAGKQILNKNIIINVNDCTAKSSDKCDTPSKSIFNLYFSKDENVKEDAKKSDIAEKVYSDKYVKRKEPASKTKEKDNEGKKRHNSSSSIHSIVSPKESSSSAINSISHITSPKSEVQKKLKPIDMFVEQHKKANVHQSRRNTAVPPVAGSKAVAENKPKPVKPSVMKIIKKHVGTQIIKKLHSKETQTIQNKTLSPIKKKMLNKAIQTELEQVKASDVRSNDAFERMKEIDLEIQVLLQEKFKLYNSLEAKDCNSMQTLGMTVLTPVGETKEIVEDPATTAHLSEDAIVDEFTNIPVEELEQIALESVQSELHESPTKPQHKGKESKKGRSKKRKNTSSISLIEQIISDDRPLEEIISLDELEIPKTRSKKKSHKKTKKKVQKRSKSALSCSSTPGYELKECYIKLIRKDYSRYLKPTSQEPILDTPLPDSNNKVIVEESNINVINDDKQDISVEETVVDDMQFDMLDVSEDIIIGDICEIKSAGDKDASEKMDIQISEEIILDNSQSSSDDVVPANVGPQGSVCKMYDYSADEDLKRDSVVVTGNSDAVLAIECIDNNFIAACLDGNVYYFSGDGQLINTMRGSNLAVTCLTIVKEKYGTTVYTGSLDSRIRYYDLETCLEKGPECNVLSPIQTMDRAWDTVFVGTRTGFVLQFECKNNMLIPVSTVKFSEQSILALRAMKEGPRKVLLVAARSENVTIKDAQTGLLLRTLEGPKMTVYTLLYEDGKVFCGTSSHQIHAFDYTSGGYVGTHEGGKGCVCLRATGGLLFSGCYDGCVYIYRDGESQPLAQLRGPSLMLLSLAIVGTKIIAGYKDRSLYIWKIPLTILQEMIL